MDLKLFYFNASKNVSALRFFKSVLLSSKISMKDHLCCPHLKKCSMRKQQQKIFECIISILSLTTVPHAPSLLAKSEFEIVLTVIESGHTTLRILYCILYTLQYFVRVVPYQITKNFLSAHGSTPQILLKVKPYDAFTKKILF